MTRRWLRAVACALAGVLFAAQLAIAAYVCPALSMVPANMQMPAAADAASSERGVASAGLAATRNCEDMAGAMDPSSPNLCAEHCKYGQQSDKAATLNAPAAVLVALYATPLMPEPVPLPRLAAAAMSALVAAAPPHAILHCVFRI